MPDVSANTSPPLKPATPPPATPFRVFISYAREDAAHLAALETHLANLKRQGWIDPWTDRMFIAGEKWETVLLDKLKTADMVLMLVSADFNASDYVQNEELPRILKRHARQEICLIPIVVRPADLEGTVHTTLQCLPLDDKGLLVPIAEWTSNDRAWLSVVQALRKALEALARSQLRRRRLRKAPLAAIGAVGLGWSTLALYSTGLELQVWAVVEEVPSQPLPSAPDQLLSGESASSKPANRVLRPLAQGMPVYHNEAIRLYASHSQEAWGMVLTESHDARARVLLPEKGDMALHWRASQPEKAAPVGTWYFDATPGDESFLVLAARSPAPLNSWLQAIRRQDAQEAAERLGEINAAQAAVPGEETEDMLPCPGGKAKRAINDIQQLRACFPENQREVSHELPPARWVDQNDGPTLTSRLYSATVSEEDPRSGLVWVWLKYEHRDNDLSLEGHHEAR